MALLLDVYEREARAFVVILAGVSLLFFFLGLWLWGAFTPGGFDAYYLLFGFETIAYASASPSACPSMFIAFPLV